MATTTKKRKPDLRKSKADVADAPKEKKPKKPYATEMPDFVYEDGVEYDAPIVAPKSEDEIGTVILVLDLENEKKKAAPVRLDRRDFPQSLEGESAFWDYKITLCEFRKAKALRRGDPLKKQKDKLAKMLDAVALLKKKIAEDGGDED